MIRSTRRFVGSRHRRARVVGGLLAVAVWTACGDRTEAGESGAGSASDGAVRSSGTDTALARLASELLPGVEQSSRIRAARPPALASSSRESLEGFLSRALVEQLPDEKAGAVAAVYLCSVRSSSSKWSATTIRVATPCTWSKMFPKTSCNPSSFTSSSMPSKTSGLTSTR
jgi:hypothetical protein